MSRIQPLTGSELKRQVFELLGLVREHEFHTTNDQLRIFLENVQVGGGVYLGEVADEALMLDLNIAHARGCWPGDLCVRTDEDSVYLCISNRGSLASDWILVSRRSAGSAARWEPVTNGDASAPEILFEDGDVMMELIED